MLLDDYVTAILNAPRTRTRSKITVGPALRTSLRMLREISEEQIREWGMPVKRNPHTLDLRGGHPWQGQRTGVDWPEHVIYDPARIGTIHTHPYAKKLDPNAKIGFSIGDFTMYGATHPAGSPVAVHFVVCCHTVFLAIYRDVTQLEMADDGWQALETDENESDALVLRQLRRELGPDNNRSPQQEYEFLKNDVLELDMVGRIDESGDLERRFYAAIPGYIAKRSAANKSMIQRAANQLRFELYTGRIGGTLTLKSNRVYFSGGLKGKRQRLFG